VVLGDICAGSTAWWLGNAVDFGSAAMPFLWLEQGCDGQRRGLAAVLRFCNCWSNAVV
jgi:hypothetical protein